MLEISSQGVSDELTSERDFKTFKGFPVNVELNQKNSKIKFLHGLLYEKSKDYLAINIGKIKKYLDEVLKISLSKLEINYFQPLFNFPIIDGISYFPGLNNSLKILVRKKLPPNIVEVALREALLKGYEKYRRTFYIGASEDPFDEEYFSNFDVGLDLDEEGYRILSSKIIVEEVESEDHQILWKKLSKSLMMLK